MSDTKKNDGGQAYPGANGNMGMTLRDYFAGQALAGIVSQNIDIQTMQRKVSVLCYEYADAMLEARK